MVFSITYFPPDEIDFDSPLTAHKGLAKELGKTPQHAFYTHNKNPRLAAQLYYAITGLRDGQPPDLAPPGHGLPIS